MEIKHNKLTIDEYLSLRASVNWKVLREDQAKKALDGSLYLVSVYDQGQVVGMGRIVGDGAVISYIQDLVVRPDYQRKGIGRMVIEELIQYVKDITFPENEMMLCLMCAKGREQFYQKYGFIPRPTDALGPGMIQYIKGSSEVDKG